MEPWLSIHKRISDSSLAPFLAAYVHRLKGIYESGIRRLHRHERETYWTADLRIDDKYLHIGLDPRDHAYFEFFTTGKPIVTGNVVQDSGTFTSVKAACVGVDITLENGVMTTIPKINTGVRSFFGQDISLVKRAFQVQLIDEPVINQGNPSYTVLKRPKYVKTLFESFSPMHSHTGVHIQSYTHAGFFYDNPSNQFTLMNRLGTVAGVHGGFSAHTARDTGFDVPFETGKGAQPVVDALLNDDIVDWPRANGIQLAKSEQWGDREFAIYIDAFSQVSAFSTSRIGPLNGTVQNVDPMYVKTQLISQPSWVYKMTERFKDWYAVHASTGLVDFPENDWKISRDGMKACAVVYKREAVNFDAAFWVGHQRTGSGVTIGRITPFDFAQYCANLTGYYRRHGGTGALDPARFHHATGLLEIHINIEITGPNDEDFDLGVDLVTLRDPETTEFCTLFAGYVYHDIINPEGPPGELLAADGDLCVWDIECYYRFPISWPKKFRLEEYTHHEIHLFTDFLITESSSDVYMDDITLYDAQITLGKYDHERFWGVGTNFRTPTDTTLQAADYLVENPYSNQLPQWTVNYPTFLARGYLPPPETHYLWGDCVEPNAVDIRRRLYSLKNLTTGEELRTVPAALSGVARPVYMGPYVITDKNSENPPYMWNQTVPRLADDGTIIGISNIQVDSGLPGSAVGFSTRGTVLLPYEPYAQFIRIDMSTLSYVLAFTTGTQEYGQQRAQPTYSAAGTSSAFWYINHPATAVYTFNQFRELFAPESLPDEQREKLEHAATFDFRTEFLDEDTDEGDWTLLPLSGHPPGGPEGSPYTDWTSDDMTLLRYWICFWEDGIPFQTSTVGADLPFPQPPGELAYWWGMIHAYSSGIGLVYLTNPRFLWHMYADCIQNALYNSPWSTFFVHPNGTWAFYDQSRIYNRNGLPDKAATSAGLSTFWAGGRYESTLEYGDYPLTEVGFDPAFMEHFVADRVHLEFKLSDGKVHSLDSTFMELYNTAVELGKKKDKIPDTEVFEYVTFPEISAKFTLEPPDVEDVTKLRAKWYGGPDSIFVESSMPNWPWNGFDPNQYFVAYPFAGNSGTIDVTLDALFSGSSPQASSQRVTFSSCLLIENI